MDPDGLRPFEQKTYDAIYCGQINPFRGALQITEAVKLVKQQLPDIRVLLLGPFPDARFKAQIQRYITHEGLQDNVILHGQVPYGEIEQFYQDSRIGLGIFLPVSIFYYGIQIKTFEYMTFGLPVICSNFGNINRIVSETGTGIPVDPLSPVDISKALVRLLTDSDLYRRCSLNGIHAVKTMYNWKTEEKKLLDVYQKSDGFISFFRGKHFNDSTPNSPILISGESSIKTTRQIRDFVLYLTGSLVLAIIAIIRLPVFTNHFTPAEFGIFSLVTITYTYLSVTLYNWISSCIYRYYHEYRENQEQAVLLSNLMFLFLAASVILLFVTITWFWLTGSKAVRHLIIPAFCFLFTNQLFNMFLVVYKLQGKALNYNLYQVVQAGISFLLILMLIFWMDQQIEAIFMGQILINVLLLSILTIRNKHVLKMISPGFLSICPDPETGSLRFHRFCELCRHFCPDLL